MQVLSTVTVETRLLIFVFIYKLHVLVNIETNLSEKSVYVCMNGCVYVCMNRCVCVYVWTGVCMYVWTGVCMYVNGCVYVCLVLATHL